MSYTGLKRALCASAISLALAGPAWAAEGNELRICAAENEAPYSLRDGSGFENRIASIVADTMGREPVFVWSPRPAIYLVRDYLDKNLCDVVMGLDEHDERVSTTRPYYRSGYVFVSRQDRNINIKNWNDPALGKLENIALGIGTPAEQMLKAVGMYGENMNYMYSLVDFKAPRNQYVRVEPSRMVTEVIQNKAAIAIAFGAEVGRYVRNAVVPLKMEFVPPDTVPDEHGRVIEFEYSESMAVRKGDDTLLNQLNQAIAKAAPRITALLQEEGIPLRPLQ